MHLHKKRIQTTKLIQEITSRLQNKMIVSEVKINIITGYLDWILIYGKEKKQIIWYKQDFRTSVPIWAISSIKWYNKLCKEDFNPSINYISTIFCVSSCILNGSNKVRKLSPVISSSTKIKWNSRYRTKVQFTFKPTTDLNVKYVNTY